MARNTDTVELFEREDGKVDWRRRDENSEELCGSLQGYENPPFAWRLAHELCSDLPESAFHNTTGHTVE